jgi:hypothetical protein
MTTNNYTTLLDTVYPLLLRMLLCAGVFVVRTSHGSAYVVTQHVYVLLLSQPL